MQTQVVIEEHEMPLELSRLFEGARRNLRWFSENAERLDAFNRYRGRYVAAAGGELFIGGSRAEVEQLARAKYPEEMPHIRRIPAEKRAWIYASTTTQIGPSRCSRRRITTKSQGVDRCQPFIVPPSITYLDQYLQY